MAADDAYIGENGQVRAEDVDSGTRFVIFQYDFTTVDPQDGGTCTYGATPQLYRGDDRQAAEASLNGKFLVADETGANFTNKRDQYSLFGQIYGVGYWLRFSCQLGERAVRANRLGTD
ncbi:MAG: hypothetical protein LBB94_08705 [Clostridiales bacterium]|jgi:hypothetical protein|nr:hypothetical protein [Clostridiales bacterium]